MTADINVERIIGMKKGCLITLVLFILLIIGGAAFTFYYLYAKEQEDPMTFNTQTAEVTDIIQKSVATGSVIPRKEILIKPQISGIIKEIYVEAGDSVREGDLIAKVKVIPDMVSLNNADNRVSRAKISLDNASLDFSRNQKLLQQEVIAKAEFQTFEIAKRQAEEELKAAEDNLQIVKEGVSKSAGKETNTLIRATIAGMVLDVPVEKGNSVIEANTFNEGTTIASVADMKDLIFEGNVDESEVEKLQQGMDLIVKIGAIEGKQFDAVLEYIAPKGVDLNGAIQFTIKAAVNLKSGEFIRAGYSANADVVLGRRDSVLAISEALLQFEQGQKPFVEVMTAPDTYERREVELGLSDGLKIEVISGLTLEDQIKIWNRPQKR